MAATIYKHDLMSCPSGRMTKLLMVITVLIFILPESRANIDSRKLYANLVHRPQYSRLIRPVNSSETRINVKIGLKLTQLIDLVSGDNRGFLVISRGHMVGNHTIGDNREFLVISRGHVGDHQTIGDNRGLLVISRGHVGDHQTIGDNRGLLVISRGHVVDHQTIGDNRGLLVIGRGYVVDHQTIGDSRGLLVISRG